MVMELAISQILPIDFRGVKEQKNTRHNKI